ncbi:hypothetical protein IAT38_000250 [Cryptococcus sp. DSM 104549]
MLKALDVAHLTRPSRIRCRPHLFAASRSISSGRPQSDVFQTTTASPTVRRAVRSTGGVPVPARKVGKSVEGGPVPSMGPRRAEVDDYGQAQELARLAGTERLLEGKGRRVTRKSNRLPSIHSPDSWQLWKAPSESSTAPAPATTATSAPSASQSGETKTVQATPSPVRPVQPPSRKGKEKLDQLSPSYEPTFDEYDHVGRGRSSGVGASEKKKVVTKISGIAAAERAEAKTEMSSDGLRRNPVGVQMLSPSLHSQVFPGPSLPKPPQSLLNISKRHLAYNDLSPDGAAVLPEISFDLPPLRGNNIRDHFHALGQHTSEPYASMAKEFAKATVPAMPKKWEMGRPGWTKYHADGRMEAVDDLGDETVVTFDVEVLYKYSKYPVMATAATPNAWYSWLCPTIFETPPDPLPPSPPPWDKRVQPHHPHDLVPLFKSETSTPRIVVGHNVGYDRARVKEEYSLKRTSTRWLDTLSLHVATRGITSVQRPAWMAYKKNKLAKKLREQENLETLQGLWEEEGDTEGLQDLQLYSESIGAEEDVSHNRWEDVTSMNSLAEVAKLHCGYPVDKSVRSRFGDDDIKHASQLRPELHALLTYCADDVRITHDVYTKVFPLFLDSCPHPASLSGVLSMGNSFLPVNESWGEYLEAAEGKYREMDTEVKKSLRLLAEKMRAAGAPEEGDPWASQLDWTPKSARWTDKAILDEDGEAAEALRAAGITGDDTPSVVEPPAATAVGVESDSQSTQTGSLPVWLAPVANDHLLLSTTAAQRFLLPLILRLSFHNHPVAHLSEHSWCFMVPFDQVYQYIERHGEPVELGPKDGRLDKLGEQYAFFRIGDVGDGKKVKLTGKSAKSLVSAGFLTSPYQSILRSLTRGSLSSHVEQLWECAKELEGMGKESNPWSQQLDWTPVSGEGQPPSAIASPSQKPAKKPKAINGTWPKWYWDLTGPPSRRPPGDLDLTCKKSVAPLLLRLQWQGFPLFHSRDYKWLYRIHRLVLSKEDDAVRAARGPSVEFTHKDDAAMAEDADHVYFRLPHKDGEGKNVGNPLSKMFVKPIESGELASAAAESGDDVAAKAATAATTMNAYCSYWISSRERIMDQMVVYSEPSAGMILPQVITMGTVTRRAVESTWLTASNAKKNRVGSELKAMVRAPPGYSIVGADVDSEELWISSVMGDSQFGMHGATAIGWMTLEGTKSAGTDLHSKTANILGISRDAAKVFNYSRIYGAGKKHAVQLLLQGDSKLTQTTAGQLAENLYKATKGSKSMRARNLPPAAVPSIWHGGSESYLFNTLEAIALSDRPTTPALGCGVTRALRKSYLEEGSSYLPSRVNWVVQSSGVDYLHLLIVGMEYLIAKYDIKARYLISVHDEVRYLAEEGDRYRTAMALQVANAWTRALFCYNLGMDDMPQGITFFSAVDVDHVLRKEVFLTCETPSHPKVIPAGESLDIKQLLEKVPGGDLGVARPDDQAVTSGAKVPVELFPDINSSRHRDFLEAQANQSGGAAKRYLDTLPKADMGGVVEVKRKKKW